MKTITITTISISLKVQIQFMEVITIKNNLYYHYLNLDNSITNNKIII